MANQPAPTSSSGLKSPQLLVAVISGAVTLIAAVIGVLPNLVGNNPPATVTPAPIIVTATPVPAGESAVTAPPAPTATAPQPTPLNILLTDTSNTPIPVSQPGTNGGGAPNVQLLYDAVSFTLVNQSGGVLSLEGVTFQSSSGAWDARQWGPSIYSSLPAAQCLRLRDAASGPRPPPSQCADLYGLIEVGSSALFWLNAAEFTVMRQGQVLATCATSAETCAVFIASSS